ncbi:hypothetical protein BDN72DRAFT_896856 [Pluteus cervinus]|uniref:Uncharacterized protein n=1 Tax=Pluteus cervinus TaxID=181527 RepID=A0ACD3AX66_9AGAR|nr:hypothetical protein BDN72DRAFT_896856 [Pluteus cervinus]
MSSLIPPSMIPSFNGTLGVMFIGMSLGAILYGITCAQIFLYATSERSHKDTWPLKTWIYICVCKIYISNDLYLSAHPPKVVDTAHQITTTMTLYRFLITDYLNPIALLSTSKSSGAFYAHITAIFITVVIFQVQLFFAWRLWTFGHSVSFGLRWILSFLTFSTAVLTFSCGIIVAANTVPSIHLGSTALDPLGPDVISWQIQLPAAIACDLFITFGMVLNLYHARTSFQRTNEVLNSLLLFTVNSGLLLVVVSTACLITFYVLPADNLTFVALEFLIPKCYTNAMLATFVILTIFSLCLMDDIQCSPHLKVKLSRILAGENDNDDFERDDYEGSSKW